MGCIPREACIKKCGEEAKASRRLSLPLSRGRASGCRPVMGLLPCQTHDPRDNAWALSAPLSWGLYLQARLSVQTSSTDKAFMRMPHLALLKDMHGLIHHCCAVGRLLIQHLHIGAARVGLQSERNFYGSILIPAVQTSGMHSVRSSTGRHTASEPKQSQHGDTRCWSATSEKMHPLYISHR